MKDDNKKVVSLSGAKGAREAKGNKKETPADEQSQNQNPIYCSFCNRPNTKVVKMVKGPGVNICSECTMIAVQYLILEDSMPSGETEKFWIYFGAKFKCKTKNSINFRLELKF